MMIPTRMLRRRSSVVTTQKRPSGPGEPTFWLMHTARTGEKVKCDH